MIEGELSINLKRYFEKKNPNWKSIDIRDIRILEIEHTNLLSEIYFFDLDYKINSNIISLPSVLKISMDDVTTNMWDTETNLLKKLGSLGYPVPKIYGQGNKLVEQRGSFMVIERIEGEMLNEIAIKNENSLTAIKDFLDQYIQLMIKFHNLDWKNDLLEEEKSIEQLTSEYFASVSKGLKNTVAKLEKMDANSFKTIIEWLYNEFLKLEDDLQITLIHGDFSPNNIIVSHTGNLYVIDWGMAEISDIRVDIFHTYFLTIVLINRKIADYIIDEYFKITEINDQSSHFFKIYAIMRTLYGLLNLGLQSSSFHKKINKFISRIDFGIIEGIIKEQTLIPISNIEQEFRKTTNIFSK